MDLATQIAVRYQSDGHVRLQLPAALSTPAVAASLAAGLRRLEGVYRVDAAPRQRKLSIRYLPHIRSLQDIARELNRLINAIEWADLADVPAAASLPAAVRQRVQAIHPIRWLRAKAQEARETVTAMKVLARRQSVQQKAASLLDNDTVIHYLNEVLVIFLIKLHWPQIRNQWIKQPWLHRYEWMAAAYMIYLLVRSRRPAR